MEKQYFWGIRIVINRGKWITNLYSLRCVIFIKVFNALESPSISEFTVLYNLIPWFKLLHGRLRFMHVLGDNVNVQFKLVVSCLARSCHSFAPTSFMSVSLSHNHWKQTNPQMKLLYQCFITDILFLVFNGYFISWSRCKWKRGEIAMQAVTLSTHSEPALLELLFPLILMSSQLRKRLHYIIQCE